MTQMMPNLWMMTLTMIILMMKTSMIMNHYMNSKKTSMKMKMIKTTW